MREEEIRGLIRSHQNMIGRLQRMLKVVELQPKEPRYECDRIIDLVNDEFKCFILENNRKKRNIYGRHAAAYLLKNHTNLIWQEIAYKIGNSHHTTVIHSYKVAKDLMETDDEYLNSINKIKEKLQNSRE